MRGGILGRRGGDSSLPGALEISDPSPETRLRISAAGSRFAHARKALQLEGAAATATEAAAGKSSATAKAATTAESRSARAGARRGDEDLMHIRGHSVHRG